MWGLEGVVIRSVGLIDNRLRVQLPTLLCLDSTWVAVCEWVNHLGM